MFSQIPHQIFLNINRVCLRLKRHILFTLFNKRNIPLHDGIKRQLCVWQGLEHLMHPNFKDLLSIAILLWQMYYMPHNRNQLPYYVWSKIKLIIPLYTWVGRYLGC